MLKQNGRVVITGDSITECGRAFPIGNKKDGLGSGYADMVNTAITAIYPEKNIEIYNTGISGNSSYELYNRFDSDVMEFKPSLVTMMIGINDVERYVKNSLSGADKETLDFLSYPSYEERMRQMIEKVLNFSSELILITPFYLEFDCCDIRRKTCNEYADTVRFLAKEYGLKLLDTQKHFDEFLVKAPYTLLSADKIHPNKIGHHIIAKELLKLIEIE